MRDAVMTDVLQNWFVTFILSSKRRKEPPYGVALLIVLRRQTGLTRHWRTSRFQNAYIIMIEAVVQLSHSQLEETRRALLTLAERWDEQAAHQAITIFSILPLLMADGLQVSAKGECQVEGFYVSRMASEALCGTEILCFDGSWPARFEEPPACYALMYDAQSHTPIRLFRIRWERDDTYSLMIRFIERQFTTPFLIAFAKSMIGTAAWLTKNSPPQIEHRQWFGKFIPLDPDMTDEEREHSADSISCFYKYEDSRDSLAQDGIGRRIEKTRFFSEP